MQFGSTSPTDLVPEFQSVPIFAINPGVRLENAVSGGSGQALFDEPTAETPLTIIGGHGEMMQIPATSIVTA